MLEPVWCPLRQAYVRVGGARSAGWTQDGERLYRRVQLAREAERWERMVAGVRPAPAPVGRYAAALDAFLADRRDPERMAALERAGRPVTALSSRRPWPMVARPPRRDGGLRQSALGDLIRSLLDQSC